MDELLKIMMALSSEAEKKNQKVDVSKIKEDAMDKSVDENAVGIKKLYDAFVKAGFSASQAFELVKVQLSSMRISR